MFVSYVISGICLLWTAGEECSFVHFQSRTLRAAYLITTSILSSAWTSVDAEGDAMITWESWKSRYGLLHGRTEGCSHPFHSTRHAVWCRYRRHWQPRSEMSYSLRGNTGPGARWWLPNHHNVLWVSFFEGDTQYYRLCYHDHVSCCGLMQCGMRESYLRSQYILTRLLSFLIRGTCAADIETISPCPDTWVVVNQNYPGCTFMPGSRIDVLLHAPCHCKPPLCERMMQWELL